MGMGGGRGVEGGASSVEKVDDGDASVISRTTASASPSPSPARDIVSLAEIGRAHV